MTKVMKAAGSKEGKKTMAAAKHDDDPMPVMTPRFAVGDVILWGKMVKMWATGKPYKGVDLMPVPRTLAELLHQCEVVGLEVTVPAKIKALTVLTHSEETLFLRIPPKDLVENSEAFLKDKRTEYPKMQVYDLYEEFEDANGKLKKEKHLDFHAARVGDYSIAKCC